MKIKWVYYDLIIKMKIFRLKKNIMTLEQNSMTFLGRY